MQTLYSIYQQYEFLVDCIVYAIILLHIGGIWYYLFPNSLDAICNMCDYPDYYMDDAEE